MALYAVINCDIIGSTKITGTNLDKYIKYLRDHLAGLRKDKSLGIISDFEIYRGDSFQGALSKPEKALRVAILLRSLSRMGQSTKFKVNPWKKSVIIAPFDIIDLRIAVGIGTINKLKSKLMESDGDAFHRSGRLIDSMKKRGVNLAINTPSEEYNQELEASWSIIDAVINKWTASQAEVVFYALMGQTQIDIATTRLKATPSAVNQRLKAASWSALEQMVLYFEGTFAKKIKS